MQSWDIEVKPGPGGWRSSLSVCHWNLNSILVEDFSKLSQMSAVLNIHQFDIFCLTETFLDSSISSEDPRLAIEGYKLFRCDHPSNLRSGGVCLYFKDHLPTALRPDLTALDECLVCEIQNGSKRFFLSVLYLSPSQSSKQFSLFRQRWEGTIININDCSPTIAMNIGHFNARNSEWWIGDSTNLQGTELAELVAQNSLNQIIDGPTHILPNSASCIDLIFTTETNFVTDPRVLPSLFLRCYHQLIFAKVSFTTSFPPAYEGRIWDFSRANINAIRQFSAKFMKSVTMIHFIITLRVMFYFLRVTPALVKVILAYLSCCP